MIMQPFEISNHKVQESIGKANFIMGFKVCGLGRVWVSLAPSVPQSGRANIIGQPAP